MYRDSRVVIVWALAFSSCGGGVLSHPERMAAERNHQTDGGAPESPRDGAPQGNSQPDLAAEHDRLEVGGDSPDGDDGSDLPSVGADAPGEDCCHDSLDLE